MKCFNVTWKQNKINKIWKSSDGSNNRLFKLIRIKIKDPVQRLKISNQNQQKITTLRSCLIKITENIEIHLDPITVIQKLAK